MEHYDLFIDNEFMPAFGGERFEAVDPGTGLAVASVAKAGRGEAEAAVAAARRAFDSGSWSGLKPAERLAKVIAFADEIAKEGLRLAFTEAMNSGQIIGLAKFEPLMGVTFLRNLGRWAAAHFPWEEEIPCSGNPFAPGREYIRREPLGVCVGIVPWNFPMLMAFWKIAPAIVMGNTVVLKPASATPLTALIIAAAARAAGLPPGVVNVIAGPGEALGEVLCTHPDVDKIAFTGSTAVGRRIMEMAAGTIKKVTLELGGKSANIILDDADLELAVEGAAFGTFFHQGQVCESGTRILVPARIHDEFVERLKKRAESLRIGYQLDPRSHLGPLVSETQLATVERYVELGISEGAELVTGGRRVEVEGFAGGFYFAPTIFANVKNSFRIAQEEIFGPVACIIKYESDEEAVAIANDSPYGLAGGVFSRSTARAERIARAVRTGTMWINNYHVFADMCPFGGYKQSGLGREMGAAGLAEYTQIKRVHVAYFADHRTNMTMQLLSDDKRLRGACFHCPTKVVSGRGALGALAKEVADLGCRRAFLLTDAGVQQAGLAGLAREALADFYAGSFTGIPSDPDTEAVDAAVAQARSLRADCIVSVGGGSVIDTGKAVAVTLKSGGTAEEHLSLMMLTERQTPHLVIPTTAGTGSEVTNVAVLTSRRAGRKLFIVDPKIVPDAAILDPAFTVTLPPALTASTALDALTHAVEALTSIMANPFCDGLALHALRLIRQSLPSAVADGQDLEARLNLQIAATMAGWAFSVAQVGLAHGLAHTLGTLHHLPHGTACGIVIPQVMRFNAEAAADKLALAAVALGVDTRALTKGEAALSAALAVEDLMKEVGHPLRLRDVGITEDALPICAFHAIADTAVLFNARPVNDPAEILELLRQAY